MANIYAGPDSCYCRLEGQGCGVVGVTATNVSYYINSIFRDLARGWTYDHSCNRIPMTRELAVRRITYLIALNRKHVGRVQPEVRAAVQNALRAIHMGAIPAPAPAIPVPVPAARSRRRVS